MKEKKPYVAPYMKVYHVEASQLLCMSSADNLLYGGEGNGIDAE